jgi:hypothetical protein
MVEHLGKKSNASLIDTGGRDGRAMHGDARRAPDMECGVPSERHFEGAFTQGGTRLWRALSWAGMRSLLWSSNASSAVNYKLFDNPPNQKNVGSLAVARQDCRQICDICG